MSKTLHEKATGRLPTQKEHNRDTTQQRPKAILKWQKGKAIK